LSIHPSQIITGEDLTIRWSPNASIANFIELGVVSSYSLALQWQVKDTIPVNSKFEETAKLSIKGSLNLTTLTSKGFEMPDYVWIEIGLLIRELANGDRWMWNRTGKYLVLNDVQSEKPDDLIQHQYSLSSQGSIVSERVLVPTTRQVFWKESYSAAIQIPSYLGSTTFVKIL
jgi:hypothetical protein